MTLCIPKLFRSHISSLPEARFGVTDVRVAPGLVSCEMDVHQWMVSPEGGLIAGVLAVAVDQVAGAASSEVRPVGCGLVTTELSLDLCAQLLHLEPARLYCEATVVNADAGACLTRVRVADTQGATLAMAAVWMKYLAEPESQLSAPRDPGPLSELPEEADLAAVLCAESKAVDDRTAEVSLPPLPEALNVRGDFHGGVLTCASEMAARLALHADGPGRLTTSSIRVAFLRPVRSTGPAQFIANAVHRGRHVGLANATVLDAFARSAVTSQVVARSLGH
jgi:uncharacterized protein (TIGR00369 family)